MTSPFLYAYWLLLPNTSYNITSNGRFVIKLVLSWISIRFNLRFHSTSCCMEYNAIIWRFLRPGLTLKILHLNRRSWLNSKSVNGDKWSLLAIESSVLIGTGNDFVQATVCLAQLLSLCFFFVVSNVSGLWRARDSDWLWGLEWFQNSGLSLKDRIEIIKLVSDSK